MTTHDSPAAAPRGPHLPELDGVRGVAILMVLALHFVCSAMPVVRGLVETSIRKITGYGLWGVDLFFVLSGFLITGILWDTRGRVSYFKTFYIRRTLRIFPLYYATLLVIVVLLPAGLLQKYAPEALQVRDLQWWLWSYLTNVYVALSGKFDIPYVSHFWTLAVEEHFYLVWPFVVGLLARRTVLRVSIIASLAALVLRVVFDLGLPGSFYGHVLTPCRLDALCIGAFFAVLVRGPLGTAGVAALARRGVPLAALGVLLTSLLHVWRPHGPGDAIRGFFLAVFFGFGIVLASWQGGPRWLKRVLLTRGLRFLGKYSYGLYVFHAIIAYWLGAHDTLPHFERLAGGHLPGVFLQAAVATAASVAIAVASYELFEVRFLRLKDRVEAKTAKPVGAAVELDPKAGGAAGP